MSEHSGASAAPPPEEEQDTSPPEETRLRVRRGAMISALQPTTAVVGRLLVLAVAVLGLLYLLSTLWVIVLPLLLALLLASVLWPLNGLLRKIMPKALAAALSVLGLLGTIGAVGWFTISVSVEGVRDLSESAVENIQSIGEFAASLDVPFELPDVDQILTSALTWLQDHSGQILAGVTSGIGTLGSVSITALLALVLTFFCLKDGDRFSGWLLRWTTGTVFVHTGEVAARSWRTLSAYILAQAAVAMVDAVFIGLGLWILGVPLALPLAVLIFFAGFLPIIGAVGTGILATLVALLANGWVTALIALGLVLLVQQLESNVLQPSLGGKSLKHHPAVALPAVPAGGTIFGLIGAFLAPPIIAVGMVAFQYGRERLPEPPPPGTSPAPAAEPVPPGTPAPDDVAAGEPPPASRAPAGGRQPAGRHGRAPGLRVRDRW
ncbi:AI-2E family transporter [Arthrobacter sp. RIT-PI-e]|uniref:AI-2E family transporter n=1 Tax=Arthrobacter sp. RIT-PI-e TaxID=1681197 RepID=UPI000675F7DC|nr:AI-2E family transporter [Arthrobacter sp. RIT-PI-e]